VGRESDLFICKGGLKLHWEIPVGTKKIQVSLHDGTPSVNAHRFFCDQNISSPGISIVPEQDEEWQQKYHGTYWAFGGLLAKFRTKSGSNTGWMEVSIIE
jgi:hypothetical protein